MVSPQPIVVIGFTISGKATTDVTPKAFSVPAGDSTKTFIVQSTTSSQRYATVTYIVDGQTVTKVDRLRLLPAVQVRPEGRRRVRPGFQLLVTAG